MAEQPKQADEEPVPPEAPLQAKAPAPVRPPAQILPAQAAPQPAGGGKAEPRNQDARAALRFVGVDPLAEETWYEAINDPELPASERNDLIEDLNEEGFADPADVTAEEFPLVVSRLFLIEELAPYAMDEVNQVKLRKGAVEMEVEIASDGTLMAKEVVLPASEMPRAAMRAARRLLVG